MDELLEPFSRMLASLEGRDPQSQWAEIEQSGYLDALKAETDGGAGLSLSDVEPLLRAVGYHGVAQPVGATMIGRAGAGGRPLTAILAATEIAGAAERVLEITLSYANDRVQFGKAIAKQQAVQHQLAVMGEHVLMARMASQIGCACGLAPSEEMAAVVKQVTSAAVPQIVSIAHAVHGAIGITQEYALQRFTKRMHALRMAEGSESYWAERLGRARLSSSVSNSLDFIRAL